MTRLGIVIFLIFFFYYIDIVLPPIKGPFKKITTIVLSL